MSKDGRSFLSAQRERIKNKLLKENMKKLVWIAIDSFGRDLFSRQSKVFVEELFRDKEGKPLCNGRLFGPLPATLVRKGAYWSDTIKGVSGWNVLVEIEAPSACGELIGEVTKAIREVA